MIYMDNAATTMQKPPEVAEAVLHALGAAGNSARGAHAGSLNAARILYEARAALAQFFSCPRADHVAFACNATEALNTALFGLLSPGDHVISTDIEHNSVLRPLYRLQDERGVALDFVPADKRGNLEYAAFEALLRPNTRAIVCTQASNITGNLTELSKISAVTQAHGVLLIVDAAQTAGCFPIDMTRLGIDVLCFTGHKGLFGPQGTGGLCIREGVDIRPFKVGGSGVQSYSRTQPAQLPSRLEAGTQNAHGIAGLHAALTFINDIGVETIHEKELSLTRRFYNGACAIPGVRIYGDHSGDRAAIVSLNLKERESAVVADALFERYGIAVRAGAHCAPRMHRALGTERQGAVRFSFSWYNTESEIDAALDALQALARE